MSNGLGYLVAAQLQCNSRHHALIQIWIRDRARPRAVIHNLNLTSASVQLAKRSPSLVLHFPVEEFHQVSASCASHHEDALGASQGHRGASMLNLKV